MYKFPFQVDIDVTNACNYDCIYCCADAKYKFDNELTFLEIVFLIDSLYQWGVMDITFAGGEPFLRKDIMDIMKYANEKRGLNSTIVTNGSLLSEQELENLEKLKNVNLLISFDSADPQIYDMARKIYRGIENFQKQKNMRVLLVCGQGMSTSLLVQTMYLYADEGDYIESSSFEELVGVIGDYDVVLVSPQIRYRMPVIERMMTLRTQIVGLIDMKAYGKLDGQKIYNQAKELFMKIKH